MEILNAFNAFTLKKAKSFSKNLSTVFLLKVLALKTQYFHAKLPCQKPMLRQIEWGVQDGPITLNGDFPVTILVFWKLSFSLRPSHKELIWSTNYPDVHIHTSWKRSSFIWGCFFPVSILKVSWHSWSMTSPCREYVAERVTHATRKVYHRKERKYYYIGIFLSFYKQPIYNQLS